MYTKYFQDVNELAFLIYSLEVTSQWKFVGISHSVYNFFQKPAGKPVIGKL